MAWKKQTVERWFWRRVKTTNDPQDCWEWIGPRDKDRNRYAGDARHGDTISQFALAQEYGVTRSAIERIVQGRGWSHV